MWTIRRASRRDSGRIFDLCHAAVGPDDYVPDFLDAFLATGVVVIAEDRGRVIGMVVYHNVPDGSAWLHAARTHPDQRRRGVATALMSRCEGLARQRHRSAMRLWAAADNVPSVQANRKFGYRELARFTRLRCDAQARTDAPPLEPLRVDARTWPALQGSSILQLSGGFLYHDFYFLRADRPNLEGLARAGALWKLGDVGVSLSAGVADTTLQVQPLFGGLDAALRAAPMVAAVRGSGSAEVFLPHRAEVLERARAAGYRRMGWGWEAILFEKRLRPRRPEPRRVPRKKSRVA